MAAEEPQPDEVLAGGVANANAVVRRGSHVLRPSNDFSDNIFRYLTWLAETGFDGASVPVGFEADGRERLDFIEGDVAIPPYPAWSTTDDALESMARLLVRHHEATVGFDPADLTWSREMADPDGGTAIYHNDVCLENVVFRDGEAIAIIDFEFAAPGRPLFDIAAFARMCVPIDDPLNSTRLGWGEVDRARRLRLIADVFDLSDDQRSELMVLLDEAIAAGGQFVARRVAAGDPGFVAMWEAMGGMGRFDRRRDWWAENRPELLEVLTG